MILLRQLIVALTKIRITEMEAIDCDAGGVSSFLLFLERTLPDVDRSIEAAVQTIDRREGVASGPQSIQPGLFAELDGSLCILERQVEDVVFRWELVVTARDSCP